MYFFHGELAPDAVTHHAALLTVCRRQCLHMGFGRVFGMTSDAGAGDRLQGFDGSIRLRNQSRQQPRRQRQFVGARDVTLDTVSTVAGKANVG